MAIGGGEASRQEPPQQGTPLQRGARVQHHHSKPLPGLQGAVRTGLQVSLSRLANKHTSGYTRCGSHVCHALFYWSCVVS